MGTEVVPNNETTIGQICVVLAGRRYGGLFDLDSSGHRDSLILITSNASVKPAVPFSYAAYTQSTHYNNIHTLLIPKLFILTLFTTTTYTQTEKRETVVSGKQR